MISTEWSASEVKQYSCLPLEALYFWAGRKVDYTKCRNAGRDSLARPFNGTQYNSTAIIALYDTNLDIADIGRWCCKTENVLYLLV